MRIPCRGGDGVSSKFNLHLLRIPTVKCLDKFALVVYDLLHCWHVNFLPRCFDLICLSLLLLSVNVVVQYSHLKISFFNNILQRIHDLVLTYILLFHVGLIVYVFMVGAHAHFICRKHCKR